MTIRDDCHCLIRLDMSYSTNMMSESANSLNDDEKTDVHRLRHARCMNSCHLNCVFLGKTLLS
jgi:hypothetical protein